ncbi:MAG TPA: hypothetical protein PLL26_03640 [Candidatus Dojkabacteria bacterium]|nr:hypothetical protein [Candidatus Dojkabacteria bacterium]
MKKENKLKFCNVSPVVNSSAFTIVELLLAITIIGLLFGGGIGGYLGLQKRTAVDQSAMNLKKDIEYMKHAALLNRSDSNDQRWVSGFAIRIYKDGDVYKYRKYKYCSDATGFKSYSTPLPITQAMFVNNKTVCDANNQFISFEKNEEIIIDKRVGKIDSFIGSFNTQLIVFETITGEMSFYRLDYSNNFRKVISSNSLEIKLCSSDNRAKRGIIVNQDSRIQLNYLTIDDCN